ncbi:MAG: REP-associated tyrosine transposase [Gaiellaceae bacterium]|jgi:REP element-mobilizing transposase RayT|nr:REP-associated tyrosine transposase [Gaiellaceae bacterium]
MPRALRLQAPGAYYHVTSRGVDGIPIFVDNADREVFISILATVVEDYALECHSYCLLSTHFHLVLGTPEANLAAAMQRLNSGYAQSYNRRYGRKGHLFERRYHSEHLQTEAHLLETVRYVALNPVRAGICDRPDQWRWSSYRQLIGTARVEPWLIVSEVRAWLGAKTPNRVRAFVEAH